MALERPGLQRSSKTSEKQQKLYPEFRHHSLWPGFCGTHKLRSFRWHSSVMACPRHSLIGPFLAGENFTMCWDELGIRGRFRKKWFFPNKQVKCKITRNHLRLKERLSRKSEVVRLSVSLWSFHIFIFCFGGGVTPTCARDFHLTGLGDHLGYRELNLGQSHPK